MNYHILIPARGGSKRFPGKNLYPLGGLPLILHTINFSLDYFSHDKIWVNSDDEKILDEAKKMGVNYTNRPNHLAQDSTPTSEVCKFQINEFERLGIKCDALIILQATSPFRPKDLLSKCIDLFEKNNRDSLLTVTEFKKKIGTIKNNYYSPINYIPGQRSQDKTREYFENGLLYISKIHLLKKNVIISDDVFPYIVNDFSSHIDIDYQEDILLAEFILNNSFIK
jgi:CMP-N-acetylneuraminic acid synthetase